MKIVHVYSDSLISDYLNQLEENDILYIHEGEYKEKLKINKSNITIIGVGDVVITNSDYSKKIHKDHIRYNTFRTYTVMLKGDNITLKNLTIKNESDYNKHKSQAVSLHILGNNILLDNVKLYSHQDTLFLGPLPYNLIDRYKYFLPDDEIVDLKKSIIKINNSYIEGNIDFIFGSATAIFINTEFKSNGDGYVFAPSTYENYKYGFIIINSKFTTYNKDYKCYISRPWRDNSKVMIIDSVYDNHINDLGFIKWSENDPRINNTLYYEFNSYYLDKHIPNRSEYTKELSIDEVKLIKELYM